MTRIIVIGIIMAFAVGFVGCRSCMAPYDHCQPTFLPERGDQCMGELYRCGSNLGGMERYSSATGDCPNCGGGSVEYYSNNGYENAGVVEEAVVSDGYAGGVSYAPTTDRGQIRTASYGSNDFSLNDDGLDAY